MQAQKCQFVVRKKADGSPWIALQPGDSAAGGASAIAGFELYAGSSLAEAKQLARLLNNNIKGLASRCRD
jgi:urocanate hydratase